VAREVRPTTSDEKRFGFEVRCTYCGRMKKPIGRDSMDNGLCDEDCTGYQAEPEPCDLWPGEAVEVTR